MCSRFFASDIASSMHFNLANADTICSRRANILGLYFNPSRAVSQCLLIIADPDIGGGHGVKRSEDQRVAGVQPSAVWPNSRPRCGSQKEKFQKTARRPGPRKARATLDGIGHQLHAPLDVPHVEGKRIPRVSFGLDITLGAFEGLIAEARSLFAQCLVLAGRLPSKPQRRAPCQYGLCTGIVRVDLSMAFRKRSSASRMRAQLRWLSAFRYRS